MFSRFLIPDLSDLFPQVPRSSLEQYSLHSAVVLLNEKLKTKSCFSVENAQFKKLFKVFRTKCTKQKVVFLYEMHKTKSFSSVQNAKNVVLLYEKHKTKRCFFCTKCTKQKVVHLYEMHETKSCSSVRNAQFYFSKER